MLGLSARAAYSLNDCGRVFVLEASQQASCKKASRSFRVWGFRVHSEPSGYMLGSEGKRVMTGLAMMSYRSDAAV